MSPAAADALSVLARALPSWTPIASAAFLIGGSAAVSFVWVFAVGFAGRRDVRALPADAPWHERARVVRAVSEQAGRAWVLSLLSPAVLWAFDGPLLPGWAPMVAVLAAVFAGSFGVHASLQSTIRPRSFRRNIHDSVVGTILTGQASVFGIALWALTPHHVRPLIWVAAAFGATLIWMWGIGPLLLRATLRSPTPRAQAAIERASARIGLSARAFVVDLDVANAFAVPGTRLAGFTTRAEALFDDEELEAIALHEIGHLRESRRDVLERAAWTWGPYFLLGMTGIATRMYGWNGTVFVLFSFAVAIRSRNAAFRRLEMQADAHAHEHPTYARALLKLHEDALAPLVSHESSTHPSTYDRLVAAGAPPPFPRPAPARASDRVREVKTFGGLIAAAIVVVGGLVAPAALVGGRASVLLDRAAHAEKRRDVEGLVDAAYVLFPSSRKDGVSVLVDKEDCAGIAIVFGPGALVDERRCATPRRTR